MCDSESDIFAHCDWYVKQESWHAKRMSALPMAHLEFDLGRASALSEAPSGSDEEYSAACAMACKVAKTVRESRMSMQSLCDLDRSIALEVQETLNEIENLVRPLLDRTAKQNLNSEWMDDETRRMMIKSIRGGLCGAHARFGDTLLRLRRKILSRIPSSFPSPLRGGEERGHLAILVDETDRRLERDNRSVEFGRKLRAWKLVLLLIEAGNAGVTRRELFSAIWSEETSANRHRIDQERSTACEFLIDIGVDIVSDDLGVWKLDLL